MQCLMYRESKFNLAFYIYNSDFWFEASPRVNHSRDFIYIFEFASNFLHLNNVPIFLSEKSKKKEKENCQIFTIWAKIQKSKYVKLCFGTNKLARMCEGYISQNDKIVQ